MAVRHVSTALRTWSLSSEPDQFALHDVASGDDVFGAGQGLWRVPGGSGLGRRRQRGSGDPVVLLVFPGALDGVDDNRSGVVVAGQLGPQREPSTRRSTSPCTGSILKYLIWTWSL